MICTVVHVHVYTATLTERGNLLDKKSFFFVNVVLVKNNEQTPFGTNLNFQKVYLPIAGIHSYMKAC